MLPVDFALTGSAAVRRERITCLTIKTKVEGMQR